MSRTVKVVANLNYTSYIRVLAKIKLYWVNKYQFRVINKIPHVFEINPRFSSTVKMRDMIGFKDLIWSIESKKEKI